MSQDFLDQEWQQSRLSWIQAQHALHPDHPTLPPPSLIAAARASLPDPSSPSYLTPQPAEAVAAHVTASLAPALSGQSRSGRYYGFVTGAVLPVAQWADGVVSHADQNVQVHLPGQTIATEVEDASLAMLAALLRLDGGEWRGRTLTTGATGSNVLGLACGREAVVRKKLAAAEGVGEQDVEDAVGELGLLAACARAGVTEIQVLTSAAHSSLSKATSVVGLGRRSVKELRVAGGGGDEPWRLDLAALEEHLARPGAASIIALSAGEVNTGRYSLAGADEMVRVRELADRYGAWIHVDGGKLFFPTLLVSRECVLVLTELDG